MTKVMRGRRIVGPSALFVVPAVVVSALACFLQADASASVHPKSETTTTVMGGGNPSTWPAAKPYPPSLAGAYSPNMKTAFIALTKYSDWVGTHPNPNLVKNYASPKSNIYAVQVYLMSQMRKRQLHLPPTPTTIYFLWVAKAPVAKRSAHGVWLRIDGHPAYSDGSIDVVIDQVTEPYLDKKDHVIGYTARGTGPKVWFVTLGQNATGQFVILGYYEIMVHGSIKEWEQRLENR